MSSCCAAGVPNRDERAEVNADDEDGLWENGGADFLAEADG